MLSHTKYSLSIASRFAQMVDEQLQYTYNYSGNLEYWTARENEEVTTAKLKSTESNGYNFVFFVGHGRPDVVYTYDGTLDLKKKQFGGKTYWAWFYSCQVLKDAANGETRLNAMFNNGVHSVLGFATNVTAEAASIDVPREFAKQWISRGKSIWASLKAGVQNQLHNLNQTVMEPQGDGTSISVTNVPAIAYRWGFVNGRATELSNEKFATAYKGPVLNSSAYNNDPSYFSVRKQVYTRPTYDRDYR